jgi:hypothetical protein
MTHTVQHHDDNHGHEEVHNHGHDHNHGGGQGDEHPSGWVGRLRHGLSEIVGGHSHDAADQIDDALEANAAGRRALVISLVGLGVTAAGSRSGRVRIGGSAGGHAAQRR